MEEEIKKREESQKENQDAEYIAILKNLEPAGTAEIAETFGVGQEEAHRRLGRLRLEEDPPVNHKSIQGVSVWFINEPGLDARAAKLADKIRSRMDIEDGDGQ
jgi:hypothetical protein